MLKIQPFLRKAFLILNLALNQSQNEKKKSQETSQKVRDSLTFLSLRIRFSFENPSELRWLSFLSYDFDFTI